MNNDNDIKKSSYDWLGEKKYSSVTILGYHGWDSANFQQSMSELITEGEFNKRLSYSRIECNPSVLMEFTD